MRLRAGDQLTSREEPFECFTEADGQAPLVTEWVPR